MEFEWNSDKRVANLVKHGVDFVDAVDVLYDVMALTLVDEGDLGEE
ncbi:MAG: BrnT family toxin [Phycisphaerales bacterium]|nr:BrnT family toxin [Phycisphaerales bacterium]